MAIAAAILIFTQGETMTKILVIEDEVQSRNIFLECLEAEGFDTLCAENGRIGLQKAQDHLPDLVLCDVVMPELDGYGVITALRQDPVTAVIPFIFLTAKSTRTELRRGMDLGADDYLTKPATVEQLLAAIAIRLEKQAALRQWCAITSQRDSEQAATNTGSLSSIFPSIPKLSEVFEFIEANYQQSITLRDVAEAVGYSSAYLTNSVRHQTGKTVNRWIVERRMVAACTLLLETDKSVDAIAEAVGYLSPGHFFRQFRQYQGTTPQVWRKVQRI